MLTFNSQLDIYKENIKDHFLKNYTATICDISMQTSYVAYILYKLL